MFCSHCGAQLANNGRFCSKCGASVGETTNGLQAVRKGTTIVSENEDAVSGENLKEAISILYDMEQDIYATSRMIDNIDQKISHLALRYQILPPIKTVRSRRDTPVGWIISSLGLTFGVIGASSGNVFWGIIRGGLIGIIVGVIVSAIVAIVRKHRSSVSANKKYEQDCERYRQAVNDQEQRIREEMNEISSLNAVKADLLDKIKATKTRLQEFYDMVGIDDDYRNLVPMGYMNDYLRLKIATQLHGTNGLYYLIRKELREDMLRMTMEEISNKLSELIDINKAAFYQLVALTDKCDQIIDEVGETAHAMARTDKTLHDLSEIESMNAYYNSRIAAEEEYRNRMDTICGRWS